MPRQTKGYQLIRSFFALFSKAAYHIVLFLIRIGDAVRYFIRSITRIIDTIIKLIVKYIKSIITLIFTSINRLFSLFVFRISIKSKYFFLGMTISVIMFSLYQGYVFVKSLPDPKLIGIVNYPVSTQITDRNGILLYEVYHEQNRIPVNLQQLPDILIKATIAAEDKDYYNHKGISLVGGIFRAVKDMILTRQLEGGSTITQQLVKTALLTPERTLGRKIKEIILALWTEREYSKNQILQMYFNQVPYGGAAYGVEEAAHTYFGKKALQLTMPEAAFLAGLPQAPSLYSPYDNPKGAQRRRDEVIKSMYQQKYITKQEYDQGLQTPLVVVPPKNVIRAPHFVFYVKSLLEKKYGIRKIEEGGLRITTSLDASYQEAVETILREELSKVGKLNISNGAILVTAPSTGEILAMVGSKDYFESPFGAFNVTTASRQPGSSIKPLMYSLALQKGYTAATIIEDSPVEFKTPGGKSFRPINYDGRYHGHVPLRYALANSYNIPAVKVLNTIGVDNFINHATNMGISTWNQPERYGLSLTLGGGDVRMTEMAVAYGVLANRGEKVPLNPILKIETYKGEVLYDANLDSQFHQSIVSDEVAFILSDILSDNEARRPAFGANSRLEVPGFKVAVKTGTTNDKRDNWTIGYTSKYLTAVWVGNNNNSPMNQALTSGITGAAPIWNRVMSLALQKNISIGGKLPVDNTFKIPPTLIKKPCYFGKIEYFVPGTQISVKCNQVLFTTTPTPIVTQ